MAENWSVKLTPRSCMCPTLEGPAKPGSTTMSMGISRATATLESISPVMLDSLGSNMLNGSGLAPIGKIASVIWSVVGLPRSKYFLNKACEKL
eukprot:4499617-Pyramimonas_sp.AAC.1